MSTLTIQQVNENLATIFPDKQCQCVFANEGQYILDFGKFGKVGIDSKKQVFVKWPDNGKQSEYEAYCTNWKRSTIAYITKQFLGEIYIPLIWEKKTADESLKAQHAAFLNCVGYGKKIVTESDAKRLSKLAGNSYSQIYKIIKELTVISTDLITKDRSDMLLLSVKHATGEYRFPITNITPYPEHDEEIQNIFFRLLGMAQTNQSIAA
jgi:hypothetical protein